MKRRLDQRLGRRRIGRGGIGGDRGVTIIAADEFDGVCGLGNHDGVGVAEEPDERRHHLGNALSHEADRPRGMPAHDRVVMPRGGGEFGDRRPGDRPDARDRVDRLPDACDVARLDGRGELVDRGLLLGIRPAVGVLIDGGRGGWCRARRSRSRRGRVRRGLHRRGLRGLGSGGRIGGRGRFGGGCGGRCNRGWGGSTLRRAACRRRLGWLRAADNADAQDDQSDGASDPERRHEKTPVSRGSCTAGRCDPCRRPRPLGVYSARPFARTGARPGSG